MVVTDRFHCRYTLLEILTLISDYICHTDINAALENLIFCLIVATQIWINIGSTNALVPDGTGNWVDLSSKVLSGIHLIVISQTLMDITSKICLGIIHLKLLPYLPGINDCIEECSLITRFMGPTWGPAGADRAQVGPKWAPWTLLSGLSFKKSVINK